MKDAPANTWLKLAAEPDGARDGAIFYYAADLNKFFLSGGVYKWAFAK